MRQQVLGERSQDALLQGESLIVVTLISWSVILTYFLTHRRAPQYFL